VILFFLLFLTPLTGVIAYTMTLSAHWMHSASEQIRLDATVLSLCHSQKAFYQLQIQPLNSQIRLIQLQMVAEVAACTANPAYCPAALTKLERLQRLGAQTMQAQDHLRWLQVGKQSRRLLTLKTLNQLGNQFGSLNEFISTTDGLKREVFNPQSETGSWNHISPPQTLIPSEHFRDRNIYRLSFRPRRQILGQEGSREDLRPFQILLRRKLESRCQVEWDRNVKRLRDHSDYDVSL
jgi:hypothetical protein